MHEIEITGRFSETDALGHINNTSYFVYLEEARIKFFQLLGFNMKAKDWNFILASTTCNFINQGYFNQIFSIKTCVSKIGTKSFQLEHDIVCAQTKQIIASASAVVVYYNYEEQKSEQIPELLKSQLAGHMKSECS
jgi:acyl-CoA thioester hydrolase